jgi:Tol biopolymer transport system component
MTRSTSLAAPALIAAAALAGCGTSDRDASTGSNAKPAATTAAADLPPGRFAFRRFLDDAQTHGAIFTINTDGIGDHQITDPPAGTVDDQPDWSPDGTRLAFERCSDERGCIVMTVRAAGGQPKQVKMRCRLKGGCDASAPAWMPDGRLLVELAEGSEKANGDARQIQQQSIVIVDLDSGHQRTVVRRSGWKGGQAGPAVSADGRTVVYTRNNSWLAKPPFAEALYAVRTKGGRERRISPFKLGGGDHPAVSPDGTVLFRSYDGQDSRQSDYWTVGLDGRGLEQLTHFEDGTLVRSGSYSPDGKWIVHASDGVDGNADLFVMKADGTGNRPFTRTKAWDSAADWGPAAS